MLETIQDLFERELHTRQHRAMGACYSVGSERATGKRKYRGPGGDYERQVRDDEPEANETAGDSSHSRKESTHPHAP